MANDKKISELPIAETINASDRSILISNNADYQFDFEALLQFINSGLNAGADLTFGPTLPQNTSGKNGDVFINTAEGSFAQKIAGVWTVVYTIATGGAADTTILYGTTNPGASTGNNGDTFINTVSGIFYKKTGGTWSQVFSMQTGPQGPQGASGTNGTNGNNGKTILNGTGNPANGFGTDGDFYINTSSYYLFGPKNAGVWGSGISLIVSGVQFEETDNKNTPNGYAGLDSSGKIAAAQLPGYIDDVLEVSNFASLPTIGETGKIYITTDTNNEYRWSGSVYIQIVASPGTTDAVPEGTTNKYFTASRVLNVILTGIGFGSASAIAATDSILQAFGKLQAQITSLFKIPSGGTSGQILAKNSNADGDLHWVDTPAGGGGGVSGLNAKQLLFGKSDGNIQQDSALQFDSSSKSLSMNVPIPHLNTDGLIFLGDSITNGIGGGVGWAYSVAATMGWTVTNLGVGGKTVTTYDTSLVPIKTSDMKYIFIAFGTNEVAASTGGYTTVQFQSDYNAFLSIVFSKGWAYNQMILVSTFASSTNGTPPITYNSFNTVIQNVATSVGAYYVEVYNSVLALGYKQALLTNDGLHPSAFGHGLIAKVMLVQLASLGIRNFAADGQSLAILGGTQLSSLKLIDIPFANASQMLFIDESGNVVRSYSIPDKAVTAGLLYLTGGLLQQGAVTQFTTFDETKDFFLNANAKIGAGNNQGAYIVMYNGTTGDTELRNYFGSGNFRFYVTGSQTQVLAIGSEISTLVNVNVSQGKEIYSANNNKKGSVLLFDNSGNTSIKNTYSSGNINLYCSNGTDGAEVKMFQISKNGRVRFGTGIDETDVKSAILSLESTTMGFATPRMTTTQRDAIALPEEGLEVYNLDTHKKNFYNGSVWEVVASA